MRGWRNRQTRWIQVPVPERAWGFNSPLAHQRKPLLIRGFLLFSTLLPAMAGARRDRRGGRPLTPGRTSPPIGSAGAAAGSAGRDRPPGPGPKGRGGASQGRGNAAGRWLKFPPGAAGAAGALGVVGAPGTPSVFGPRRGSPRWGGGCWLRWGGFGRSGPGRRRGCWLRWGGPRVWGASGGSSRRGAVRGAGWNHAPRRLEPRRAAAGATAW